MGDEKRIKRKVKGRSKRVEEERKEQSNKTATIQLALNKKKRHKER